jgi:hypothetical protein
VSDGQGMGPEELAAAVVRLTEWATAHAPQPEPELRRRLREHLGEDPAALEVVSHELHQYDQVNFQLALDERLRHGVAGELIGLPLDRGFRAGLAELAKPASPYMPMLEPGPMEHVPVDVGDREVLCIKAGLVLLAEEHGPWWCCSSRPTTARRAGCGWS